MIAKERMKLAMRHGKPDRVPVMCQLALGHYFLQTTFSPIDIWYDSSTYAQALVDRQRAYGFDGILVNLPGRPTTWRQHVYQQAMEDGQLVVYWDNDLITRFPPDDNPYHSLPGDVRLPRVSLESTDPRNPSTWRQVGYVANTWHLPAIWDIPSSADLSDPDVYPDWFTLALRTVQSLAPDVSVQVEVFSPFTHVVELLGYTEALLGLKDAPEMCHRLLRAATRIVLAQVANYGRCRPDAILVSSAFAGAGYISREMYQTFVLPYERQVHNAIQEFAIPSYVHTCGAIGDRLDLMAESGSDGIDTLDPPPLGTIDLREAMASYGERFFFKGNLDAVNELLNGDDATFEAAVRERLEIGGKEGGYILSSACSVAPYVSPERLRRLVELAEEHGS